MKNRIGIFGWGVVAPKSPDIETFENNLKRATTWLEPFGGFGPSNFLVGRPEFDFEAYRPWIEARFEPFGLEILSVALSSDADHIITPSEEGPRTAMRRALEAAGCTTIEEIHEQVRPYFSCLVADEKRVIEGDVAGKINMGVGGINACTICRRW